MDGFLVHWGPWGAVSARRAQGRGRGSLWTPVGSGLTDRRMQHPPLLEGGPWGGPLTCWLGLLAARRVLVRPGELLRDTQV